MSTLEAAVRAFLCHDTATHAPALALLLQGVRRSQSSSSNGNGIETPTCPTFVCLGWHRTCTAPLSLCFSRSRSSRCVQLRELCLQLQRGVRQRRHAFQRGLCPTICNQRRHDGIAAEWCCPTPGDSSTKTDTTVAAGRARPAMIPILVPKQISTTSRRPSAHGAIHPGQENCARIGDVTQLPAQQVLQQLRPQWPLKQRRRLLLRYAAYSNMNQKGTI